VQHLFVIQLDAADGTSAYAGRHGENLRASFYNLYVGRTGSSPLPVNDLKWKFRALLHVSGRRFSAPTGE
jgi:hypothetical protein